MLSKEQVKVFNELLATKDFKGKNMLSRLLWANTTEPRYKKGDCFLVTSPGHFIFGRPVRDFKAMVTKSMCPSYGEHDYFYELEMDVRYKDKSITSTCHFGERYLTTCTRCDDNYNIMFYGDENVTEEMSI